MAKDCTDRKMTVLDYLRAARDFHFESHPGGEHRSLWDACDTLIENRGNHYVKELFHLYKAYCLQNGVLDLPVPVLDSDNACDWLTFGLCHVQPTISNPDMLQYTCMEGRCLFSSLMKST